MTPVQRVTRYNLLLSDIAKCFKKAGDEEIYENIRSALEHAHEICEYANNMMIAGRISGFPVSTYYNYYTLNSHSAYVAKSTERMRKIESRNFCWTDFPYLIRSPRL